MKQILEQIKKLKKSGIKAQVDARIKEFKELGKKSNDEIFKELCFCILTANYSAEGGIRIQKAINDGFLTLSEPELVTKLKEHGHRFPNMRAQFIVRAREHKDNLVLDRDWLVKNIKGIGYKEASHFLRNIGFCDCAIVDFHILDSLVNAGLMKRPNTMTKKIYLEAENILKKIGKEAGLNMAQLDLYLWCTETGKVLK